MMLQLATSLVMDLSLSRPPLPPGHVSKNKLVEEAKRVKGIRTKGPHTLEEMRAFLAIFSMTSV